MNSVTQSDDRHLSAESFEQCLRSRVPVEHPIKGDPPITLFIDPGRGEIGIRIPVSNDRQPEDVGRENVRILATHRQAGRFLEVIVDDPSLFNGAYTVLRTIADRIQLDGMELTDAVSSTMRMLDQLLRREESLAVEKELGLLGELLVLRQLCGRLTATEAMNSWQGSESGEHDFSVQEFDVEVKTTSAERRMHWISSLTQLLPVGERPLWLISHQLTRAGAGNGLSLGELISEIRKLVGAGQARDIFEHHLAAAGWLEAYERSVHNRWFMRAPSQAYFVGPEFPRLIPPLLTRAGISLIHIIDVRYRVDFTGIKAVDQIPDAIGSMLPAGDSL